jgi:hypothetical protein
MRFLPFFVALFGISLSGLSGEETFPTNRTEVLPEVDLKEVAKKNPKAELYRLTVTRSFDPLLRFEIDEQAIYVRKVRISNEETFANKGKLVRDSRLKLEAREFANLRSLLEACEFWELPEADWSSPGLDGSDWIFEGVKAGKYHCIRRASPFKPALNTPLAEDLEQLTRLRAYNEGRLTGVFLYLWALTGEASEEVY